MHMILVAAGVAIVGIILTITAWHCRHEVDDSAFIYGAFALAAFVSAIAYAYSAYVHVLVV